MSVRPVGFKELQAQLQAVAARASDPTPVLREVAEDFRRAERDVFARGRFKPLDPVYAARKAREGHGSVIGVYTGGLRDSLTKRGARYAEETMIRGGGGLVVGSSNPVANLFQGRHRTRNQPKRQAVKITPALRRQMLAKVQAFLTGPAS